MTTTATSYKSELAERDTLLTKMKALLRVDDPFELYDAVCAAQSAVAKPSELSESLGCNECAHADCGKFDGTRQVERRAMADKAYTRPDASS